MNPKPLSERDLIKRQIEAYEFYAGLLDRAVTSGARGAIMPRWDEQRALEYRELAEQLRQRLAVLEAEDPEAAAATPGVEPVPASAQTTPPESGSSSVGDPVTQG